MSCGFLFLYLNPQSLFSADEFLLFPERTHSSAPVTCVCLAVPLSSVPRSIHSEALSWLDLTILSMYSMISYGQAQQEFGVHSEAICSVTIETRPTLGDLNKRK